MVNSNRIDWIGIPVACAAPVPQIVYLKNLARILSNIRNGTMLAKNGSNGIR